ncbi:MAG TPA: AAA family ATPase [Phycisphaerae bacterium]|nr:AAA family ATPase [Phycisphaerae bacterium]
MPIFDVRYQERAQRILLRALEGGRLPHAYVFHGPPGVGKRMLADRLAMRLLCPQPRPVEPPEWAGDAFEGIDCVDACGECPDCCTALAGTHADLHVIHRSLQEFVNDPAARRRKGLELGVDVIRDFMINAVGKRPMRGRAKVFIIEEAERLNAPAQNAMLKTLEEPPATTFIILLTRAMDRLLPTVRSRAHPVPFRALPTEFVEAKLRELRPNLPPDEVTYLARLAGGRLGAAVQYADDGIRTMKRAVGEQLARLAPQTVEDFAKVLGEQAAAYAARIAERDEGDDTETETHRVGLRAMLAALATFYTDALLQRTGAAALPVNVDQPGVIEAIARRSSPRGLTNAIREIVAAESGIDRNVNVPLVLASLAIRLAECG